MAIEGDGRDADCGADVLAAFRRQQSPCWRRHPPLAFSNPRRLPAALAQRACRGRGVFAEGWNFGPDDNDAFGVAWVVERLARLGPNLAGR